MQHSIEVTPDVVRCTLCLVTWKKEPVSQCPGVKQYEYDAIPWTEMTTITQLKEKKLRPKDKSKPDGCYYRAKGRMFIYLYRIDEALPQREMTEKQQAALEKAQEALKQKNTCEKCEWYDKAHGQNRYQVVSIVKVGEQEKRYCTDCAESLDHEQGCRDLEQQMKVLLEAGIDVGGYREPITLLQPCATEEDRQQLREALGQLYYEGNFTDGFTLKVRKF